MSFDVPGPVLAVLVIFAALVAVRDAAEAARKAALGED